MPLAAVATLLAALSGINRSLASTTVDPKYLPLEEIQQQWCAEDPLHECAAQSVQKCIALSATLSAQLFPDDPALASNVKRLCQDRATPYDPAGTRTLLDDRFSTVSTIASAQGRHVSPSPVYGALPIPEVNAHEISGEDEPAIILMNVRFFEFANEFTKLAALSIPVRTVGDNLAINSSATASVQFIRVSPSLRHEFVELLRYMVSNTPPKQYVNPSDFTKPIQAVYTDAIETFAMAHEYGHVYYRHPSSALASNSHPTTIHEADSVSSDIPVPLRELEADSFGLQIVSEYGREQAKRADAIEFSPAMLYGVSFYFVAQDILDRARVSIGKQPLSPQTQTDPSDLERVVACDIRQGCRVSKLRPFKHLLEQKDEYPPTRFREEVVNAYIANTLVQTGENATMTAIARLVNRNALLLWQASRDEFIQASRQK